MPAVGVSVAVQLMKSVVVGVDKLPLATLRLAVGIASTDSLKTKLTAEVSLARRSVSATVMATVGDVRSMSKTWPMKGRLLTSWVSPLSLTRFSPSVPLPLPVLALMFHCVAGGPLASVTEVIVGVPPSPVGSSAKFAGVSPSTGSAKVMVQVAEGALRGLLLARFSDTTVVVGLSSLLIVPVAMAGMPTE